MSGTIVLLLSVIMAVAAVAKLRSREAFRDVLRALLPYSLVRPGAIAIPIMELVLALWLLTGIGHGYALIATIAVLAVFTVVLAVLWRRGEKGCACFGEGDNQDSPLTGILRNLLLIVLGFIAAADIGVVTVFGPDLSSTLARMTLVAGALCLWSCSVTLLKRRKLILTRL